MVNFRTDNGSKAGLKTIFKNVTTFKEEAGRLAVEQTGPVMPSGSEGDYSYSLRSLSQSFR